MPTVTARAASATFAGTTQAPGKNRENVPQQTTVAREHQVPGPGLSRPIPKNVATTFAQVGAGMDTGAAELEGDCAAWASFIVRLPRIRAFVKVLVSVS